MPAPAAPLLVWIDLEMTGLDPATCTIIEMALIATDVQLRQVAPPWTCAVWQPEEQLARMSPYVRAMHEKTGLLERVRASTVAVDEAQRQALALVAAYATYRTPRLCGNSVGYDRRFLRRYMPHLENYFHYRQIDVSSIKEVVRMWGGRRFDKPTAGQHTALGDIEQSIAELAFYRQHALIPALGPTS